MSDNNLQSGEQGSECTILNRVSRWDGLKEWFFKITVAEAGMLLLTLVIAASSIIYTMYAKRQWKAMNGQLSEMREQTRITRQEMVGTQGAVVRMDLPVWDAQSKFTVNLLNDGGVNATHVNMSAQVLRESLQSEKQIGKAVDINIRDEVIRGRNERSPAAITPSWLVPWHKPKVEEPNWPGEEAFVFRGTFSYDNGFGDVVSQEFCLMWLPEWKFEYRGIGGGSDASFQSGCDINTRIRQHIEARKLITEQGSRR